MDFRFGWSAFDTQAAADIKFGWAEFDTLAPALSVCVGWAEFDCLSPSAEPIPPLNLGALGGGGFHARDLGRYHSRSGRRYTVPLSAPAGFDESDDEEAILTLLMHIAARELA